ncbi:hypothetical protein AB4851_03055 [Burkholderia sp. 22PA0099]|uniref:hypothetical protein n=1 Tax=Burkholderia sp. 22PA0099 TaxID=3237372 RepID=UPI0039C454F7
MNWRRLYATLQIWIMVSMISLATAGCNTALVIGICRKLLGWNDSIAFFGIGPLTFTVMFILFAKYLPKPLRAAGMLSDDPKEFGPWLK